MNRIALKYVGKAAVVGVPARDLTEKEVAKYGLDFLLETKLYEPAAAPTEGKGDGAGAQDRHTGKDGKK